MFKSILNNRENNCTYNFDKNFSKDIRMNFSLNYIRPRENYAWHYQTYFCLKVLWPYHNSRIHVRNSNKPHPGYFLTKHNQVFDRNASYNYYGRSLVIFINGCYHFLLEFYPGSVIYHDWILFWFCYLSRLKPILVLLFILTESYPGSVIYHDWNLSWFCYLSWLNPILVLLFIKTETYPGSVIYHDWNLSWFCYLSWLNPILVLLFILTESFPETEFKEFELRLKLKPRLKNCWFHLKSYSLFQDLCWHSIETGFGRI